MNSISIETGYASCEEEHGSGFSFGNAQKDYGCDSFSNSDKSTGAETLPVRKFSMDRSIIDRVSEETSEGAVSSSGRNAAASSLRLPA